MFFNFPLSSWLLIGGPASSDLSPTTRLCVDNVDISVVEDVGYVPDVFAFCALSRNGHGGSDEKDKAS